MSAVSNITNFPVRSSMHLIEPEMTRDRTIPTALIENLHAVFPVTERAVSLLQTGAVARDSLARARDLVCSEYEMVMKMAEEIGFKPQEKAFIQLHAIGQERYIFVAESHANPHFDRLDKRLMELAVEKRVSLFEETVCQDGRSLHDYRNILTATPDATIYGLEGEERPLCTLAWLYSCCNPPQFVVTSRPVENAGTEETSSPDMPYSRTLAALDAFLDELYFNTPWERVIAFGRLAQMPNPPSAALFKDILNLIGTPLSIDVKKEQEYPKLLTRYPTREVWNDLVLTLMNVCLAHPHFYNHHFAPAEIELVKKLRDNPRDITIFSLFFKNIMIVRRDRSFAQALFNHPHGVVRIANMGYDHLPGTITELLRLASKK